MALERLGHQGARGRVEEKAFHRAYAGVWRKRIALTLNELVDK